MHSYLGLATMDCSGIYFKVNIHRINAQSYGLQQGWYERTAGTDEPALAVSPL